MTGLLVWPLQENASRRQWKNLFSHFYFVFQSSNSIYYEKRVFERKSYFFHFEVQILRGHWFRWSHLDSDNFIPFFRFKTNSYKLPNFQNQFEIIYFEEEKCRNLAILQNFGVIEKTDAGFVISDLKFGNFDWSQREYTFYQITCWNKYTI